MEELVKRKKRLQGIVVSTSMQKSISVLVQSYIRHPKYKKRIKRSRKFLAHDEHEDAGIDDLVEIIECRPLSKRKSFRLLRIIEKGVGGTEDDTATK